MNWNDNIKEGISAGDYLRNNYETKTDKQIALILSELTGNNVSKNAVRKARYRLGLKKENVQQQTQIQSDVFEIEGNCAKATGSGSDIDEIVERLNIDTNIWRVNKFKHWTNFAKIEGEIVGVPLFSIDFVKHKPEPIFPVIHPVACEKQYEKPQVKIINGISTELVLADPHFGFKRESTNSNNLISFHDWQALYLILEYAKIAQPNYVRILGDIFDFCDFSNKFRSSPEFANLTQPAINDAYLFLRQLRETLPNAKIRLHLGNHDARLKNMLIDNFRAAYQLHAADELDLPPQLSVERLLALHKLNIESSSDYPDDFLLSDNELIEFSHGEVARSNPYSTVKNIVENSDITKVVGHIHRIESASRTIWRGMHHRTIQAHSIGCTCRIDGTVPGKSKRQNWQQGFSLIRYTKNDYNINVCEIKKGESITEFGKIKIA